MKKKISAKVAILLIAALLAPPASAYGSVSGAEPNLKTGDVVYINMQTNENYFMPLAGGEIETNIYNVAGGGGPGMIALCLEHGSSYPSSNAQMVVKEVYYWVDTPNGRSLMYDASTRQPLANPNVTTLRNGYQVTQTDLYALDSIIQKVHSDNRLTMEKRLYAAQNAVRAYMSAKAGIFWAPGKIEYSPGYTDGSGRWTVGTVKAVNTAANDVMKLSEEYYNLMTRAQAAGRVISDGYIRHNMQGHPVNNGSSTTYQFRITSSDPWKVDAGSYTGLTELGAAISPVSGADGSVITITIPNDKIAEAGEIGLSLRTQVVRGSGGVVFLEPMDNRLQTLYTTCTVRIDDKEDIIRFRTADIPPDYPLPEIPLIIVTGEKSDLEGGFDENRQKIGRASCRERV